MTAGHTIHGRPVRQPKILGKNVVHHEADRWIANIRRKFHCIPEPVLELLSLNCVKADTYLWCVHSEVGSAVKL